MSIPVLGRFKYQFTGNEVAPPGPVCYGTVIERDVPMYPGGKAEGMLRVKFDEPREDGHPWATHIHERHVQEV